MVLHFLFARKASEYFESGPSLFVSFYIFIVMLEMSIWVGMQKVLGEMAMLRDAYFAEFPRKIGVGVPKCPGKMVRGAKLSSWLYCVATIVDTQP